MVEFPVRRRRWTETEKRQIVGESRISGATVDGVARRHGLNPGQLYRWRHDLDSAGATEPTVSGFVPVVIDAAAPAPRPVSGSVIEIVVGPVTVRLDAAIDTAVLYRVMDATRRLA